MTDVDAILARLLALHPKRIDLSLGRMWRILEALGHPERRVPPVIHVAGTNGKGSTIAFMRAMLEAAGKRVHVYTSPNLVRINERFRLAGTLVSDDELAGALAECERANGSAPITVFEIETERPIASVITSVSIDHVDLLGDTLEKIATEKAAILRRGVPAVIGRQSEGPLAIIAHRAEEIGAPPHVMGQDWVAGEERGRLVYQDTAGLLDLPAPRLFGRHQFDNAGTAIAALRSSRLQLPARAFEQGIVKADWPARMQRLTSGKLIALAPAGSEIWLDGGHNLDGGRIIAAALADLEERVSRPLVLIVGMLASKDAEGFLRNFAGLTRRLLTLPIHQDKTLTSDTR